MQTPDPVDLPLAPSVPAPLAAELQDDLHAARHDLERLQRLLADASDALNGHFLGASHLLKREMEAATPDPERHANALRASIEHLARAITAMQFEDLAVQLVEHTTARLQHCADRLGAATQRDARPAEPQAASAPRRPNPVSQHEMESGSVELF